MLDPEVELILRRSRCEAHVLIVVGLAFVAIAVGLAAWRWAVPFWSVCQ